MDQQNLTVINNEKQMQFEIHLNDDIGFLQYRFYHDNIALMHTLVPTSLSGKGLASALAHHSLEWAREHKKKVMVYCPFVAAYLKRHPEYNDLIGRQYQKDG